MVAEPESMKLYRDRAGKAYDKIMSQRCKICNKTMDEGGYSGTPRICASCLRGEING